MPNVALMKKVINTILEQPKLWDQSCWHGENECDTTHCFAGWTQVLGGRPQETATVESDAAELLGVSGADACYLFAPNRTLFDLWDYVDSHVENRDGVNRAGFDRDGFDRDGFNRAGFNRAGFDRDGAQLPKFDE